MTAEAPRPPPNNAAQGDDGEVPAASGTSNHLEPPVARSTLASAGVCRPSRYSRVNVAHLGRQCMLFPGCHAQSVPLGTTRAGVSRAFTREGVGWGGGALLAQVPDQVSSSADRRRAAAVAGHTGDEKTARAALSDPASEVRASALGALARMGVLRGNDMVVALADPAAEVRRRACDLAGRLHMAVLTASSARHWPMVRPPSSKPPVTRWASWRSWRSCRAPRPLSWLA